MDGTKTVGNFKVIVVGGGPVGLTAAHALHLAGIDFIVLERRSDVVEDKGASLAVWPQTFRVLHQFGILEKVLSVGSELHHHLSLTSNGYAFKEGTRWRLLRENHGYGPVAFHRADLIEAMYNGLPVSAKERVLTNKKLVDIEASETGVRVICADGSLYEGSIVIGADGVHSKTRHIMRQMALKDDPRRDWDPEEPFVANYRVLFGAFPTPSDPGLGYDTQAQDKSITYLSGSERSWFFLCDKLPKPTTERVSYTKEDIEAQYNEFADFHLTETTKVKDVWPRMLGAGMTNLEEGIAKHWSLSRMVLVGDACHKFTVQLGLGFNNGVQDIVVLCNNLRDAVCAAPDGNPDASTLTQVFEAYEAVRKSSASSLMADFTHSATETRMHGWATWRYYILGRFLTVPKFMENLGVKFVIAPEVLKAQVLDYVSKEEPFTGKLSWLHPMKA
ncbi:hypothetical protein NM208_g3898 [Fusarium decemcellulare]|uniref:Uncharacterized protein n=1 Tax=Fusarium decemcellulare TaxID=57161 RepID=A0ACC1SML9_9HYPO|nr:hypothetical protein NM208_g3898 [Fusarium decemcellulare]